jgi:hypothetical protein
VDADGSHIQGRNALEASAEHGTLTIAQMLLNAFKEIGRPPQFGRAIELAEAEGHFGVVEVFKNHLIAELNLSWWSYFHIAVTMARCSSIYGVKFIFKFTLYRSLSLSDTFHGNGDD